MSTVLAIIIAVVVVLALLAVVGSVLVRRRRLRERFGPEYERTIEGSESRRAGESELRAREKHHDSLDIKPLDSGARDRYSRDWTNVQQEFVDRPE
ncbi:hypothetical protein ACFWWP_34405, partial [Streptomyces sp. NPDC058695]